ncbi:Conserved_hypothetical protein [Hexamita inflata]|uniref:Lipid-binding serum glycoprotein N-terminal domain-containing protein n=1 Tax=Hexamita inflata TaxID=28002 RepID=A0AA86P9Q8_9EUKA|nr:Conserved hypothetical protein [Hexamita inflata]CAI9932487.1 Conserved hypothetical protein [Hexamita inflata]CAI9932494.1 Conserved hypothetical protein [Hexamita inflata]
MILTLYVKLCTIPDYPRVLREKDSSQSLVFSQVGAQKFIQCGFQSIFQYVQMINIPNMHYSLNLGVTSIDFDIQDIHFHDFSVSDVQVNFGDHNQTQATITGCSIQLVMQWGFKQQTYPYLNDKGTGVILIENASLSVQVGSTCDYANCPGHYKINLQKAQLNFEMLALQLRGGSSWIYQSLIDLIIQNIQEQLVDSISQVLLQQSVALMNEVMNSDGYNESYVHFPELVKDERVTGPWDSGFGYFSINTAGYSYLKQNLSDEYVTPQMLSIPTKNKFNSEISFIIQEASFSNVFYLFHKYFDIYSTPDFTITSAPKLSLVNTGIVLDMNVSQFNITTPLQLFGQFRAKKIFQFGVKQNMTQIYFEFQMFGVENQIVLNRFNAVQEFAAFQVFSPLMNLEEFSFVVDVAEKAVRIVGNNSECQRIV